MCFIEETVRCVGKPLVYYQSGILHVYRKSDSEDSI